MKIWSPHHGIEPGTSCLQGKRSHQLSYAGVWERVWSDRDSFKYQCDNLGDVTRSVTPPMTDDSCGCSKQPHYSLRLVIRLNIFDCYGRGDLGTAFLLP